MARPLAELLACSPTAASFLNETAEGIACDTGQILFRQGERCRGLYVVVSGDALCKAERNGARVTLGRSRAGELMDLSAVLGAGEHTCTAVAQNAMLVILLPLSSLKEAFAADPPLQMHLLEELAREVSRAYSACGAVHRENMRAAARRPLGVPKG